MATDPYGTPHWPTEIRLKSAEKRLEIDFDDGRSFSLPAELLRVESPSAEVQGHSAEQKQVVPGKKNVGISAVEPVGHYAVRLRFDDGHACGSLGLLYSLGTGVARDLERAGQLFARACEVGDYFGE